MGKSFFARVSSWFGLNLFGMVVAVGMGIADVPLAFSDQRCASVLNKRAIKYSIKSAIPYVGWLQTLLHPPGIITMVHDAERLEAASILSEKYAKYSNSQLDKANATIDEFHNKLKKRYYGLNISVDELIEILDHVNRYGVNNGFCSLRTLKKLSRTCGNRNSFCSISYEPLSLAKRLFPEESMKEYWELQKKYEDSLKFPN